jgi:hypothetical protein
MQSAISRVERLSVRALAIFRLWPIPRRSSPRARNLPVSPPVRDTPASIAHVDGTTIASQASAAKGIV